VSVLAHLFELRSRGDRPPWRSAGRTSHRASHLPLPPLGAARRRPRAL